MNAIVFLTVLAAASAQRYYGSYGHYGNGFGTGSAIVFPDAGPIINRPVRPVVPVVNRPVRPVVPVTNRPGVPIQQGGGCDAFTLVHARQGRSEYHFSWCADGGQKYDWSSAQSYCSRLGAGWYGVSIEDFAENQFVTQTVAAHQLTYIWTGGQRAGFNNWAWPSGNHFTPIAWSHTGGAGVPQPDNRENNAENCLAVLNNFYEDGIKWHDIACYHTKPIICERSVNTFG